MSATKMEKGDLYDGFRVSRCWEMTEKLGLRLECADFRGDKLERVVRKMMSSGTGQL